MHHNKSDRFWYSLSRLTFLLLAGAIVFIVLTLFGTSTAEGSPLANVRIPSHGASGVVIYADDQKTVVLGCAHMFLMGNKDRTRFKIDFPRRDGDRQPITTKIIAAHVNVKRDLSLLYIYGYRHPHVAPLPFAAVQAQNNKTWRDFTAPSLVNAGVKAYGIGHPAVKSMRVIPMDIVDAVRLKGPQHDHRLVGVYPFGYPGMSGGGLHLADGTLIGILHGKLSAPGKRSIGGYMDINEIAEFLTEAGWKFADAPTINNRPVFTPKMPRAQFNSPRPINC